MGFQYLLCKTKRRGHIGLFALLMVMWTYQPVPYTYLYQVTCGDHCTPSFPSFTVDVDTLISELTLGNHPEAFVDGMQSRGLVINCGEPAPLNTMFSPFLWDTTQNSYDDDSHFKFYAV